MTTISLLRHGEVEGGPRFRGSTDDPLTKNGWQQMRIATNAVKETRWNRIISSPLQRCAHFAREYALQHNLNISFEDHLKEMHFGQWEGRSAAEIMQEDPDALGRFWSDPIQQSPPDAESLLDFQTRVLEAWQNIIDRYVGQKILIITHGGVIRVLLCHEQKKPINKLLEIDVPLGSLTHIQVTANTQNSPPLTAQN